MSIAPSTARVSINRSNVIVSAPSTGTPALPSDGSVRRTIGGPTVRKAHPLSPAVAALPARSSKPGSMVTAKAVSDCSLADGVKMAFVPSHVNVPAT